MELTTQAPPGLDLDTVSRWLDPLVGGLDGPLRAALIAGGRSNLTYVIADAQREWVLRRPPLAHVLPTAHDMAREYRVISALGPTDIPVPQTIGLCTDPDVLGVSFYVMERVHGHVIRDELPSEYADSLETRATLSRVLMQTLGRLHDVDPASVGLDTFGKPAGYLSRQLARWWMQWEASATRELPEMEELRRRLEAGLPEQGAPGIVHGDYRLDNVMFAPTDPSDILAILDWEMCTLGDPLADLGLLMVYWSDPSDPPALVDGMALTPVTRQPGFLSRDELVAEYAGTSSRDLSNLAWYTCLGYYKLSIVAEGIHARFLMGQTVGEGFEVMGPRVPLLVNMALQLGERSGLRGLSG
ncbi:MAG TPA: phosphotransferase family protein [Candidatus Dormibacteraeota bacterium]|nr:phosphotransferase family protein [Candidatus Dormibacteraeota bacterium]